MPPVPPEVSLLRQARLRLTPQRLAVARVLLARNHPTVSDVYDAVRQQFPTLGLATVYNILHALAERGTLRALPFAQAVRYDVNVSPHANLVCTRCGQISDLEGCEDVLATLRERAGRYAGYQLAQERVDLYGLCPRCAAGATPTAP
ncbi:MAG TPA: Fur family transcriptional regulator [Chloroflexota bacterium]|nr:Fur family transcriptional regulator [Chloroflexota bacterium]